MSTWTVIDVTGIQIICTMSTWTVIDVTGIHIICNMSAWTVTKVIGIHIICNMSTWAVTDVIGIHIICTMSTWTVTDVRGIHIICNMSAWTVTDVTGIHVICNISTRMAAGQIFLAYLWEMSILYCSIQFRVSYTVPKANLSLCIETKPFTAVADAMVYAWYYRTYILCICTVHCTVSGRDTMQT